MAGDWSLEAGEDGFWGGWRLEAGGWRLGASPPTPHCCWGLPGWEREGMLGVPAPCVSSPARPHPSQLPSCPPSSPAPGRASHPAALGLGAVGEDGPGPAHPQADARGEPSSADEAAAAPRSPLRSLRGEAPRTPRGFLGLPAAPPGAGGDARAASPFLHPEGFACIPLGVSFQPPASTEMTPNFFGFGYGDRAVPAPLLSGATGRSLQPNDGEVPKIGASAAPGGQGPPDPFSDTALSTELLRNGCLVLMLSHQVL